MHRSWMLPDQTPTPTRFLRDCEEVGLFTDLELNQSHEVEGIKPTQPSQSQHPPFQHQQCALAHLNQNQLHTHSSQPQSQCTPTYSTSNKKSKVIPSHNQPAVSNGIQNPLSHMMDVMSTRHQPMSHLQSAPHHQAYQPHCHSLSPQRLTHHHQSQDQSHHSHAHHSPPVHLHPGSSQQTAPPLSHQPILAQTHSPQSSPPAIGGRRRRTTGDDPEERRQKFLERNRAAATRCRQKRKVWVSSLERKAEELTHTNLQLQNEVTSLRTEVTQLKQILLAHEDCPVSVRQRETQSQ
ncbi:Cyclic AMP-dependent transcription factor ATF-7 [Triplophysa tibetana]|uniref:Cyclic AMP-dependent transcription factor ATF-7 n=1 Tax=Triplophysa tibetana TaxID=1572043 RepID=A0A5A9NN15_9TELE|nr:Cyclic AMP-dependent transcription factor ATF-7 [Triplophysa tibetana]